MKGHVLLDEYETDVMLDFQTKTQNKTVFWENGIPALEACDSRAIQQFYVFSFDLLPISISKNTPSTQVDLI